MSRADPPRWTDEQFDEQLADALEAFRGERLREPVEQYLEVFDGYAASVRSLLSGTGNLSRLTYTSSETLTDPDLLEALRYLAGPPISADDLKTLADASLASNKLRDDPAMTARVIDTILASLDTKRFPWVAEGRPPRDHELGAAAMASASLMATQRVQTNRRNQAKTDQEGAVKAYMADIGLTEVESREINTHGEAPPPGSFCGECLFGHRKADIVVQLHDGSLMPIECKVSNSATNSVKRLNNDAAAKAAVWIDHFGRGQTVPSAVLSGVFKKNNLRQAQDAGLTIFWAHNLTPLGDFIRSRM